MSGKRLNSGTNDGSHSCCCSNSGRRITGSWRSDEKCREEDGGGMNWVIKVIR